MNRINFILGDFGYDLEFLEGFEIFKLFESFDDDFDYFIKSHSKQYISMSWTEIQFSTFF